MAYRAPYSHQKSCEFHINNQTDNVWNHGNKSHGQDGEEESVWVVYDALVKIPANKFDVKYQL